MLRDESDHRKAVEALERDDLDEAGRCINAWLMRSRNSARAHFFAARLARQQDNVKLAEQELQTCEQRGYPADRVHLERAMLVFQQGIFDPDAENVLLVALNQEDAEQHLILEALIRGYERAMRLPRAYLYSERLLAFRPQAAKSWLLRGQLNEQSPVYPKEAASDFRQALALRPDYPQAKWALARILINRLGHPREATKLLEELRQTPFGTFEMELSLAQCYSQLGRTEDAMKLLQELNAQRPSDPGVMLGLGTLALRDGRPEVARDWLERVVAVAPERYDAHYQLQLCWQQLGDTAAAERQERKMQAIQANKDLLAQLTKESELSPNDANVRLRIGELWLKAGDVPRAELWLQNLLTLEPRHLQAHRILASIYKQRGDIERAESHERAVRQNADIH